jgi:hypothetical protein
MECIQLIKFQKIEYNKIIFFINNNNKNDKEIILELMKLNGRDLHYVIGKLKKDKDIVYAAVSHTPLSYINAHKMFSKNKDFILLALNSYGYDEDYYMYFLDNLSLNFRNDKDIVLAAVKKCGYNIKFASDRLKNDKEIVITAIDNCYHKFNNNPHIYCDTIIIYLKKKYDNIQLILNETELRNDPDILHHIIKQISII